MPLLDNAVRCSLVSLSGSGWLFPYHLGVLEILERNGILTPSTPIQGLSGGAFVAAGIVGGVSPETMMDLTIKLSTKLRQRSVSTTTFGTLRGVWGEIGCTLHEVMHEQLPEDAWQKCNRRLTLAVTPWPPSSFDDMKKPPQNIVSFNSNEDLVEACLCSAHLPFYMDRRLYRVWRGKRWVDGGMFYSIIPPFPKAVDHSAVIMSCPVEILTRSRTDRHRLICPTPEQFSNVDLLSWFAAPPDEEQLENLRDAGRQNAEDWLAREVNNY